MSDQEIVEAVEEAIETPVEQSGVSDSEAKVETESVENGKAVEEQSEAVEEPPKGYWPDDWRRHVAESIGGDDKKAVAREMKRLEMVSDPTGLYGLYRNMESKFSQGGLVKVPKDGASDEELAEWRKAIGMPEEPSGLVENLTLANDMVLGDEDRDVAARLLGAMHKGQTPQQQADNMVNEYFAMQEEVVAQIEENDDKARREAEAELKDDWGADYRRMNTASENFLRKYAGDLSLEGLFEARMPDGRRVGDSAEMRRAIASLALIDNPTAKTLEDGPGAIQTVEEELKSIRQLRRTDRRAYDNDEKLQQRERELLDAQEQLQARA